MRIESKNLEETRELAGNFVKKLRLGERATVVGFQGDLGSGKTTFIQDVGEALGISEHMTSPTFVIQKIYPLFGQKFERLIHIDAYRLKSGKELLALNWVEIAENPKNLILIEWPEKVAGILPEDTEYIKMAFVDEATRSLDINA